MDPIERLSKIFERFPGIGPRQAGRFVQFLLRASPAMRRELAHAVQQLGGSVSQCPKCYRFHAGEEGICSICSKPSRDLSILAVVATDADLAALERDGVFGGLYFVLGGTISLGSEKMSGLRLKEFLSSLPKRVEEGLREVVLAFPANPEGDATAQRVRDDAAELATKLDLTISALGRGLSTGSELEYADAETLKSALESRR